MRNIATDTKLYLSGGSTMLINLDPGGRRVNKRINSGIKIMNGHLHLITYYNNGSTRNNVSDSIKPLYVITKPYVSADAPEQPEPGPEPE